MEVNDVTKVEIVTHVKELLATVEKSEKIKKYKYVCEIYEYLAVNKNFVISHEKFFNTFLGNAHDLIETIIKDIGKSTKEEQELMCKTVSTIIESVSSITNN
jgi:hypothetical protein